MPELPEVQTVLNGVTSALKDISINGLECFYPGTVILDPDLAKKPWPAKLLGSERRGKYMILHLSGGNSLIIHLRMTGKLVSSKVVETPLTHERACFLLSGVEKLHFIDIRTFGKIILCPTENLGKYLPKLGIEPLAEEFTAEYMLDLLRNRKSPIKNILMDQGVIAGLGNIYVNEILYRSGVHPETAANKLTLKVLKRMVEQTKDVLNEAIAKNGTSISDFRRIDDKTGEFQNFLQIYQKEKCPQGHEVQKLRQGGRSTFYCPKCQK